MTRKDYVAIAEAVNRAVIKDRGAIPPEGFTQDYRAGRAEAVLIITQQLALILASDNPRFNRDRFLAACYG